MAKKCPPGKVPVTIAGRTFCAKRKKRQTPEKPKLGQVVTVRANGGCTQDLKFVGKSKSLTGWQVVAGSRECPAKRKGK